MRNRSLLHNTSHRAMMVHCVLGSFTIARVTGRFLVGLKLSWNGNCAQIGIKM